QKRECLQKRPRNLASFASIPASGCFKHLTLPNLRCYTIEKYFFFQSIGKRNVFEARLTSERALGVFLRRMPPSCLRHIPLALLTINLPGKDLLSTTYL